MEGVRRRAFAYFVRRFWVSQAISFVSEGSSLCLPAIEAKAEAFAYEEDRLRKQKTPARLKPWFTSFVTVKQNGRETADTLVGLTFR